MSNSLPVGFNFTYSGAAYSSFLVSTNGFITFNTATGATGGGSGAPYNYNNSNLTVPTAASSFSPLTIAPMYEDLTTQGSPGNIASLNASVRYLTTGTAPARVLTVEWIGMETYGNTGPDLNFQVRLYEGSNVIEYVYGLMQGFNGTSSYTYSSSCGMNSGHISLPAVSGEYFVQQIANTRSFGITAQNQLTQVQNCNTTITFTPGTYTPYVPVSNVPSNDNSSGAITLDVGSTACTNLCNTIYTSAGATASGGSSCSGTADDDVWFKFRASGSSATIRIAPSGAYDAVVELLDPSLVPISCTDANGNGILETVNATGLTLNSTYYLRIYNKGVGASSNGQFSACIYSSSLTPANDECAGAISLPVSLTCIPVSGTNTGTATASSGIPACSVAGTNADDDVWYSFVAVNTTESVSVQSGTGFNAVVQLFSGTCGSLTPIQCANSTSSGQTETVTSTSLTIGETYLVRVYHAAIGAGSGTYTICVTSPAPGCSSGFLPANTTIEVPASGVYFRWNKVDNANGYNVYLSQTTPATDLIASNVPDTFAFSGPLLQGGFTYYWRVEPVNATGAATGCLNTVFASQSLDFGLRVRAYMEGFYLHDSTMIASIDPVFQDTLADTVTVCLASPVPPYTILHTSKTVMTIYGYATGYFPQPAVQQLYYIVVRHRNSIETWSSTTFQWNDPDTLYSFSDSASSAFGSNEVEVAPGVFAMHGGDVNQDGIIESADYSEVENAASQFLFGYEPSDLNGDGLVESGDYSFIENKASQFIFAITP